MSSWQEDIQKALALENTPPSWRGRSAVQVLQEHAESRMCCFRRADQQWEGLLREGWREGRWLFAVNGKLRFEVFYEQSSILLYHAFQEDGSYQQAPFEGEWAQTQGHRAQFLREQELLSVVLRQLQQPADLPQTLLSLQRLNASSVEQIRVLREALGISLSSAKSALQLLMQ